MSGQFAGDVCVVKYDHERHSDHERRDQPFLDRQTAFFEASVPVDHHQGKQRDDGRAIQLGCTRERTV